MTPKEKAAQLHDLYFNANMVEYEVNPMERVTYLHAKQCAIICVEQIADAVGEMEDQVYEWDRRPIQDHAYWKEVLEILKTS